HKDRASTGVVVVGIHAPADKLDKTRKVMQEFGLEYPIYIDLPGGDGPTKSWGRTFSQYGIFGIPCAFAIDQQGRVSRHGQLGEVLRKVHELLNAAGRNTPPAVRPGSPQAPQGASPQGASTQPAGKAK
ncbi:hypothetical protein LCGC14_1158290, partial [marine sediment metagenome]